MNKEQQIEEIEQFIYDYVDSKQTEKVYLCSSHVNELAKPFVHNKGIAEALYNAGYRKTFTSGFASDTQKAYKEGYIKGNEETEAEIEILKIQNKNLGIAFDRLEAENERLTEMLKQVLLSIDTVKEMNAMCNIYDHRKQAVKEFAEKLKKKVHNYYPSIDCYCTSKHVILVKDIDELLKEYEQ